VTGRLAVVAGHSVLGRGFGGLTDGARSVTTGNGVTVLETDPVVFLQRHGEPYRAPHRIDHHAHADALVERGCDRVLAVGSVGGLRTDLGPGVVVVPDDFIALHGGTESRHDDHGGHAVHGFTPGWRSRVRDAWAAHAPTAPVDGGTYWQTSGPRFETPAEIRLLATFADVVGMTVAGEAVAASEAGLAYAAVCIVDNLANGVGDGHLTLEEFEAGKRANHAMLVSTLAGAIPDLAR